MSTSSAQANTAPKRGDRRTRRSQKQLFDALMALILEKDYESITVSEIAEHADVARATFYLHYNDKDALLLSSFDTLIESVTEQVKRFSEQDLVSGVPHPALVVFEVVGRDANLFRVILKGQGGGLMLERLRTYAAQTAYQAIDTLGVSPKVPMRVIADFMAGAMLSVMTGWLEDDMRTPPDEMARQFYTLVRPSILGVLGLE